MFNRFVAGSEWGGWEVGGESGQPERCIHENLQKQLTPSHNEWING